jgi:HSP20 family protein
MDFIDEFDKMMRNFFLIPVGEMSRMFGTFPVDISETDENIIVKADLPGFNKDEVSIKAMENLVYISAQHKEKKIERTEKMFRTERKFGSLQREFMLPTLVKPETSKAEFKNGVLTITLEKKEKKKAGKEIKIS